MAQMNDDIALDFAILLHSHSAQLSNVLEWMEPLLDYLSRSPFGAEIEPTPSDLEKALQEPVKQLLVMLREHLHRVPEPAEYADEFRDVADTLSEYVNTAASKRVRAPFLYEQMEQLIRAYQDSSGQSSTVKMQAGIYNNAQRVKRIICIYNLIVADYTIREMRHQVNALHGFYSKSDSTSERANMTVYQLLQPVIQENAPFAASRNIQLYPVSGRLDLKVRVYRRDMIRALSQLLRNAIKYNYKLYNNEVWVDTRCYRANDRVCVEFENWGYPITRDEIVSGMIFRAGKRGTFAARSKQPGYGIGLADAKKVVEAHGGVIRISSAPAKKDRDPNDYNQPFLTTVTVELPEAGA